MKSDSFLATRAALFLLLGLQPLALSFAEAEDKDQYHLFNPTPRHLMRSMSTDRPDKTESAYTVDAGHFQIEMDFANYTYRRNKKERSRGWNITPINLKAGLFNNIDLQIVFDSYIFTRDRESISDGTAKREGVGDVATRLKINLWGNDGGSTALSVMPYLKFPTNSNGLGNDSVEGGLIIPLAVELNERTGLGLMTQVDVVRDDDDQGNHADFVNTITIGRDLSDTFGAYVEFFSLISGQDGADWIGTADAGVTYALSEDIQLDGGINVGVTNSADDLNPFAGLSWRF